jgi:alkylation response protein AidB-like acyl-CoA dehydrogenase
MSRDPTELARIPADFGFTPDHDLLRQSARRFLSERSPIAEVRRLVDDPIGFDPKLWRDLAELGWIGLLASPERGGAGLDHLSLALLLEEMGRYLLPAPFFGAVLALAAIEQAGSLAQRERLSDSIARGETIATVALSEPGGSWEADQIQATAEKRGDGWLLSGTKTHVLFGERANLVVAPFRVGSEIGLFVFDPRSLGVRVEPEVNVDTTRRTAKISLDRAEVPGDSRLEQGDLAALRRLHVLGYAALAAEMVGGAEAVLQRTRDYAAERQQFGRAIGAFQAVKHPIVDMMVGIELARSLALGAAAALDADPDHAEQPARMAKAVASDVYAFAVRKGVQLHGGFGFTWDCDVHFYFKRALWSRGTLGDGAHHRRHLADHLFGLS